MALKLFVIAVAIIATVTGVGFFGYGAGTEDTLLKGIMFLFGTGCVSAILLMHSIFSTETYCEGIQARQSLERHRLQARKDWLYLSEDAKEAAMSPLFLEESTLGYWQALEEMTMDSIRSQYGNSQPEAELELKLGL